VSREQIIHFRAKNVQIDSILAIPPVRVYFLEIHRTCTQPSKRDSKISIPQEIASPDPEGHLI
jgi:hypothetical protein